jgi:GntR family transcriptional regulator, transcriptional repressor for pyruvate dehydrogenase complex
LGPGDRLPAERELADLLTVGRLRVREALAALEAEGYLVTRRGATGGRFVTELERPWQAWLSRMQQRLDDLDDIIDFRLAVERQAVVFACERRTEDDLSVMGRSLVMLETAGTPRAYRQADVVFHAAVADAAHSPRLAAAVARARGELFEPIDVLWFDDRSQDSLVAHRRVVEAIDRRSPEAAAHAMTEHIEHTRAEVHDLLRRR